MRLFAVFALASFLYGGPPTITDLRPRGAQKGRPFNLTIAGTSPWAREPAFSLLCRRPSRLSVWKSRRRKSPEWKRAPRRFSSSRQPNGTSGCTRSESKAANGLSNILLFTVGAFPEITEEESRPGALPHQNEPASKKRKPSRPPHFTLNGTLKGTRARRVSSCTSKQAGTVVSLKSKRAAVVQRLIP